MMIKLKLRMFALAAAVSALAGTGHAVAQDFTFGWNPRTGDVWVDNWLGDVNRYGSRYRQPFVDEMVRYYGAPRDLVSTLLIERHWAPGDVYYACAIAQIIGRPCRYVVDEWERDHGQGWGSVAKRLGIKPGSDEFHRLKRGFVPTYDRWGRPIRIDEDLYPHYPARAKAIKAQAGNGNAHPNPGNRGKAMGNNGHGDKGKSQGNQGKNKGKGQGKGKGKD